jgi:hypothetical protein
MDADSLPIKLAWACDVARQLKGTPLLFELLKLLFSNMGASLLIVKKKNCTAFIKMSVKWVCVLPPLAF